MKKLIIILFTFVAFSIHAAECDYPCKPVTFVLNVVAGGPSDTLFARPFSEFFKRETGQPLVIEYMPAGEGVVQFKHIKAAKPDGYTLGLVRSATAVYKPVMDNVDYDPVRGITNIAFFVRFPTAIYVNAKNPAKSLNELMSSAPPQGLNIGMSFHGARILTYMMGEHARVQLEPIMYPGDQGANTALLGQHIDAVIGTIGGVPISMHRAGTFRMIAITGDRRVPSLPEVPTIRELGYNIEQYTFFAISGPPNMDPVLTKRINFLVNKFVRDPEFQAKINDFGMFTPTNNSPEDVSRYIENEIKYWDGFRKKHNIPKVDK
jgi:tripartite-type tricarboxylate transporter receptor subunit TctC